MPDILHRIAANNTIREKLYEALTTTAGLAAWWTEDTSGVGYAVGGLLKFRFPGGGFDMKVSSLQENQEVVWEVVAGEKEWIGTTISWDLKSVEGATVVLFKQANWKEATEFMHHCSTKWAIFLMSLKAYMETGKGAPSPNDLKIDDWN